MILEEPLHASCQRGAGASLLPQDDEARDQVHALSKTDLQRRLRNERHLRLYYLCLGVIAISTMRHCCC